MRQSLLRDIVPSRCWEFREFLSTGGRSYLAEWIRSLDPKTRAQVRARLDIKISLLEVQSILNPADFDQYKTWPGIFEIRIRGDNRVQFRPLAFKGPGRGQITILAGATEKGRKLDIDRDTVLRRKKDCESAPERTRSYESEAQE